VKYLRYIASMFEVLAFVYDNYYTGVTRPEPEHFQRKLKSVGFESDEIDDAMHWLTGLNLASQHRLNDSSPPGVLRAPPEPWFLQPSALSMRIYPALEQQHLGAAALGFIRFLESSGMLPAHMREVVIDRALAAPGGPVPLDALKLMVLMVYWSFGKEPDPLVLDELRDDERVRTAH
jgi:Smg protein